VIEIRDERLYRETHGTFERYCRDRWQFSRQRSHQFISAAALSTTVDIDITNEAQARELASLDGSERPHRRGAGRRRDSPTGGPGAFGRRELGRGDAPEIEDLQAQIEDLGRHSACRDPDRHRDHHGEASLEKPNGRFRGREAQEFQRRVEDDSPKSLTRAYDDVRRG
jgi:hypothetical protein